MKRSILLFLIILFGVFLMPINVDAGRGCCSSHGGVVGCGSNGKQLCADGTYSPSCTCTPPAVYGCTDSSAKNYNSGANKDDGSCQYYVKGCMDDEAKNYNASAEKDDGSCEYYVEGCTDKEAYNYDESAEKDDGSCKYYIYGCTDKKAINYNESANKDDGSCEYGENNSESGSGFGTLLTIGGIGAGIYYTKKKKK